MAVPRRAHWWRLALCLPLLAGLAWNWRWLEPPPAADGEPVGLPPTLAITTMALGPLRGLITNALWWRALRLQDEGNHFEAIQLGDWITKLQPRLISVWRYQAWNMAFNIAADVQTPEERWSWVMQGYRLLRDEGLRYNPGEEMLQVEMAYILTAKISRLTDLQHTYMKRRWAEQMMRYFPTGDRAEVVLLATAPRTEDEVRRLPGVSALLAAAAEQGLDFLALDPWTWGRGWTPTQQEVLLGPAHAPARAAVSAFVLAQRLRERERLDPVRLLEVHDQFGPFDWRLPHGYIVYWTTTRERGAISAYTGHASPMVRQAMEESFRMGRIVFISDQTFVLGNNLEIAGHLHDYLEELIKQEPGPEVYAKFRDFHEFCVVILHNYGYTEQAVELFGDYLREFPGAQTPPPTFEEFIETQSPRYLELGGISDQLAVINSSLFQAYVMLALGEEHRAVGFLGLARRLWTRNQEKYADLPARLFPPFAKLQAAAVETAQARVPAELAARLAALRGKDGAPPVEIKPSTALKPLFLGEKHERDAGGKKQP